MLEVPSRPRLGEILVAAYAVIGALGSVGSFWNGEYGWKQNANYVDPFEPYSSFFGIRLINGSALVIDALIAVIVIASLIRRNWSPLRQRLLVALCAVAAALTWFELWYGSTLRYGNRDKQGLPFGVNNGGEIGSLAFTAYIVFRLRFGALSGVRLFLARFGAVIVVWIAHNVVLNVVDEPWNLWQS